mmetsp:Transcript_9945/g.34288  ORF Transcript_9945/g.34288 Transcript_9945/m.34288 type:complete len:267 (-) Transcript_9945:403-1203(-)
MPLLFRISSPSGLVGPLAASTMYLHCIFPAISASMTAPSAAGMNMSHSISKISCPGTTTVPFSLKSTELLPDWMCSARASTSNPPGLCSAPSTSLTPTTLPPFSAMSLAAHEPTFPNPWTTNDFPSTPPAPSASSRFLRAKKTPLPVAASLPKLPCRSIGFPVTTPGENPMYLLYSSKNQAISLAPVFMSGAGMSVWGPTTPRKECTSFLVSLSFSISLRVEGSTVTPPLAPPKGMSITAVFHVISEAKDRTSSRSHSAWYRIPPL